MQVEKVSLISFIPIVRHVTAILRTLHELPYQNEKSEEARTMGSAYKYLHVTDLSIRQNDESLSPLFFSLPIIMTLALIAFTYMNYETIPAIFATHWNSVGGADGWTEKSRLSVISMPLIL